MIVKKKLETVIATTSTSGNNNNNNIIINLIYIAQFDTNDILTALYIGRTYKCNMCTYELT